MRFGDVHNFGKRTHQVTRNGKVFYSKPRPIFWEWFFAGKNSPLVSLFEREKPLFDLFGNFFGLSIQIEKEPRKDSFLYSNDVPDVPSMSLNDGKQLPSKSLDSLFFQFGSFCAYAFSFGICDMNFENIVITEKGKIQPVDIELVFFEPKFLSDTSIVSKGSAFLDFACLSHALKALEMPMIRYLPQILSGYYSGIQAIYENQNPITLICEEFKSDFINQPIRNIIRPTKIYQAWRVKHGLEPLESSDEGSMNELSQVENSFLEEELIQLERGDFPYFFSLLDDENIYFLSTASGEIQKMQSAAAIRYLPAFLKPKLDINKRFSKERLIESCLPVGLMEILWDFLPKQYVGKFTTNEISVSVNEICIRIDDHQNRQVYIADRSFDATKNEEIIDARLGIIRKNI